MTSSFESQIWFLLCSCEYSFRQKFCCDRNAHFQLIRAAGRYIERV